MKKKIADALLIAMAILICPCFVGATSNTYSGSIFSFTYDDEIYMYSDTTSDSFEQSISISAIDMPDDGGGHNTVLGCLALANTEYDTLGNLSAEDLLQAEKAFASTTCQGLFEIDPGVTITQDSYNNTDTFCEYIMSLSDGTECYTRVYEYDRTIYYAVCRLCSYTADLNDGFYQIYDSISLSKNENVTEATTGDAPTEQTNLDSVFEEEENQNTEDKSAQTEITFRDIPWGTSYTEVNDTHGDWQLMPLTGDVFFAPSVEAVLTDDNYAGIDFEYGDINITASALQNEIDVAGYTITDLELYFAYVPVDGVLTKNESDSSLYGARYTFEPINLQDMKTDLIEKLSSLYGTPAKETEDSDWLGNKSTFTYWYGANDTELVLKATEADDDSTLYTDEIAISYAWRKGDELLQTASDILKSEATGMESDVYGNENTNGL